MEKSKVLAIGCGGCGCNQLSVFLDLDKRYTGIFMNTNMSEMENLKHFDRERKCFYVANADGTGKDRDLAEQYIKEEAPKFTEKIKKFINQDYIILFGSTDGGTGSKALILLSVLIKKNCPEKSINIVATTPIMTETDIAFENSIDFWNELIELKNKKIVDTIQLIDNNKLYDENEINIRAMKDIDDGFNIVDGKLDSSDSKRVHNSKGYKVILKLDNKIKGIKNSINEAIQSSMFFMPDNFECDVAVGNIDTRDFDLKTLKEEFEAFDFNKFNDNNYGTNIVVLGGCEMPKEPMEVIREALKEIKNRKKRRVVEDDLIVKRARSEKNTQEKEVESKTRLTSKDLNDMYKDDSFWDI